MDRLGHDFLAGPALALDKDRRIRRRDSPHQPDHFLDGGILSDYALDLEGAFQAPLQELIFLLQVREFRRLGHSRHEFLAIGRLLEVVERARLHRLHDAVGRAVRGQHHHLAGRIGAAHFREQLLARHPRHHEVRQHDVETRQRQQLDRALADRSLFDCESLFAQRVRGDLAFEVVVFNDQH